MRISSRLAPLPLAALAVLLGGCPQKAPSDVKAGSDIPAIGTAKVKPHEDVKRNDTYCRYEIKGVPKDAPLKVGDILCIYCPKDKNGCDNYSKIEDADRTTYEVSALDSRSACTSCPALDATPRGWPREMQ